MCMFVARAVGGSVGQATLLLADLSEAHAQAAELTGHRDFETARLEEDPRSPPGKNRFSRSYSAARPPNLDRSSSLNTLGEGAAILMKVVLLRSANQQITSLLFNRRCRTRHGMPRANALGPARSTKSPGPVPLTDTAPSDNPIIGPSSILGSAEATRRGCQAKPSD
jgi:hypothetical protein